MMNSQSKTQILLLDDDEDDYVLVKAMLKGAFGDAVHLDWYQKDHVSTVMICTGIYAVTLVDYLLGPDAVNGIEVIQKAKAACPDEIILLFTAWRIEEIIGKAKKAGADGYLDKVELSIEALKTVLEPYLPEDLSA